MNRIKQAKEFATRKFSEVNIQNHFLEVYSFLKEDFKVKDENILIGAVIIICLLLLLSFFSFGSMIYGNYGMMFEFEVEE